MARKNRFKKEDPVLISEIKKSKLQRAMAIIMFTNRLKRQCLSHSQDMSKYLKRYRPPKTYDEQKAKLQRTVSSMKQGSQFQFTTMKKGKRSISVDNTGLNKGKAANVH